MEEGKAMLEDKDDSRQAPDCLAAQGRWQLQLSPSRVRTSDQPRVAPSAITCRTLVSKRG